MRRTHRPAQAHLSRHVIRDVEERRPVRSRFQSRYGRGREAGSRPGPCHLQGHRIRALPSSSSEVRHSATKKPSGQAHSFYRTPPNPSILTPSLARPTRPNPQTPSASIPQFPASLPRTPSPANPAVDTLPPLAPLPVPSPLPETAADPTQLRLPLEAALLLKESCPAPVPTRAAPPPRFQKLRPVLLVPAAASQYRAALAPWR